MAENRVKEFAGQKKTAVLLVLTLLLIIPACATDLTGIDDIRMTGGLNLTGGTVGVDADPESNYGVTISQTGAGKRGIYIKNLETTGATSSNYGVYMDMRTGTGNTDPQLYAVDNNLVLDGGIDIANPFAYAVHNTVFLNSSTAVGYGVYNSMYTNYTSAQAYGVGNNINSQAKTEDETLYGVTSTLTPDSAGDKAIGEYIRLIDSSDVNDPTDDMRGLHVDVDWSGTDANNRVWAVYAEGAESYFADELIVDADFNVTGHSDLTSATFTSDVDILGDLNVSGNAYLNLVEIEWGNVSVDRLAVGDASIPQSFGGVNMSGNLSVGDRLHMWSSTASGASSVALGSLSSATADYSVVSGGSGNTASGKHASVLGGYSNVASGTASIAGGYDTTAAGGASVALGNTTLANALNSFALGYDFANNNADSFEVGFSTMTLHVEDQLVVINNTLNVTGATDKNSTFMGDVNIEGTLYGGSPVKVGGGFNVTSGDAEIAGDLNVKGDIRGVIDFVRVKSGNTGTDTCNLFDNVIAGQTYTCVACIRDGGGASDCATSNNDKYCGCRVD
ncbi:MAG: hypothetical protein GF334_03475 [Candidatus Altiarchaeales archaeon]|nr:hypothetical protein [Candidatus Altiarchaeales archaeon]